MDKIKKIAKILLFSLLLLLAMAGIALPIPFYSRERLSGDKFYNEQIDENDEEDGSDLKEW